MMYYIGKANFLFPFTFQWRLPQETSRYLLETEVATAPAARLESHFYTLVTNSSRLRIALATTVMAASALSCLPAISIISSGFCS